MENTDTCRKLKARKLGIHNADVFGREFASYLIQTPPPGIAPEALAIVFEAIAEELLFEATFLRSGGVR